MNKTDGHIPARTKELAPPLAVLLFGAAVIAFAPIFALWAKDCGVGLVAAGCWRLLLSAPVWFFIWLWTRRRTTPNPHTLRDDIAPDTPAMWAAVSAGVFFGVDLALYHRSLAATSATNATLISNCAPFFVVLAAWLMLRERFGKIFVVGLVLAVAGVATLTVAGSLQETEEGFKFNRQSLIGDAMALCSAVSYAGYQLCVKRARRAVSTPALMTLCGLTGGVVMGLIALTLREPFFPISADAQLLNRTLLVLAGLAVVQLAGQGSVGYAVGHLPVSFSSVGLLFQPVVVAVLAWVLLEQHLTPLHGVGGAAVLAGIYLARKGSAVYTYNKSE